MKNKNKAKPRCPDQEHGIKMHNYRSTCPEPELLAGAGSPSSEACQSAVNIQEPTLLKE